jgi:hypothetical protein
MQNKSKIRLEIDYLEHQRDYFGVEVGDKLKELNDKLNMEKNLQLSLKTKWFEMTKLGIKNYLPKLLFYRNN